MSKPRQRVVVVFGPFPEGPFAELPHPNHKGETMTTATTRRPSPEVTIDTHGRFVHTTQPYGSVVLEDVQLIACDCTRYGFHGDPDTIYRGLAVVGTVAEDCFVTNRIESHASQSIRQRKGDSYREQPITAAEWERGVKVTVAM